MTSLPVLITRLLVLPKINCNVPPVCDCWVTGTEFGVWAVETRLWGHRRRSRWKISWEDWKWDQLMFGPESPTIVGWSKWRLLKYAKRYWASWLRVLQFWNTTLMWASARSLRGRATPAFFGVDRVGGERESWREYWGEAECHAETVGIVEGLTLDTNLARAARRTIHHSRL